MLVVVTPEAAELLETRKRWWRENRPATADLFDGEFEGAVALIAERPALFPVALRVGERELRRILMERTACHLYYEIDEAQGIVKIVSAWGAVRGKAPQL